MYRVVRINANSSSPTIGVVVDVPAKPSSIKGVAVTRLLRHGHELRADGVGVGSLMTWPDTPMGRVRAMMYKDLLNNKRSV